MNVVFCDFNINGLAGVVVDQDNINCALEVLGARIVAEESTQIEGIVNVAMELSGYVAISVEPERQASSPPPKLPEVRAGEWHSRNGYGPDRFVAIVREVLLPVVGRDVFMSNSDRRPRSEAPASHDLDAFCLYVGYGQRSGKSIKEAGEKVFGEYLGDYTHLSPEGDGLIISDLETGLEIIQIEVNRAWILCNCAYYSNEAYEHRVFRRICEELAVELSLTPEEKVEYHRQQIEAKRTKSREAYVKECSKRFEKTVAGTRQKIEAGHKEIARLQQLLTKTIRETQGAERKMEQLEATRAGQKGSYGREFDSLLQVPGVEDIQTADGVIKIFTEHVFITIPDGSCKGQVYDIGKFRMEIYTSGSNGCIRFFNLTRQGKSGGSSGYNYHHPHVNKNGAPCLGNISEMIPTLLAEYEYSAIAQIGLQYLKSVNLNDSAGREIFEYWPKVEGGKGV